MAARPSRHSIKSPRPQLTVVASTLAKATPAFQERVDRYIGEVQRLVKTPRHQRTPSGSQKSPKAENSTTQSASSPKSAASAAADEGIEQTCIRSMDVTTRTLLALRNVPLHDINDDTRWRMTTSLQSLKMEVDFMLAQLRPVEQPAPVAAQKRKSPVSLDMGVLERQPFPNTASTELWDNLRSPRPHVDGTVQPLSPLPSGRTANSLSPEKRAAVERAMRAGINMLVEGSNGMMQLCSLYLKDDPYQEGRHILCWTCVDASDGFEETVPLNGGTTLCMGRPPNYTHELVDDIGQCFSVMSKQRAWTFHPRSAKHASLMFGMISHILESSEGTDVSETDDDGEQHGYAAQVVPALKNIPAESGESKLSSPSRRSILIQNMHQADEFGDTAKASHDDLCERPQQTKSDELSDVEESECSDEEPTAHGSGHAAISPEHADLTLMFHITDADSDTHGGDGRGRSQTEAVPHLHLSALSSAAASVPPSPRKSLLASPHARSVGASPRQLSRLSSPRTVPSNSLVSSPDASPSVLDQKRLSSSASRSPRASLAPQRRSQSSPRSPRSAPAPTSPSSPSKHHRASSAFTFNYPRSPRSAPLKSDPMRKPSVMATKPVYRRPLSNGPTNQTRNDQMGTAHVAAAVSKTTGHVVSAAKKEGYLQKKTQTSVMGMKMWQARYFVLSSQWLAYYRTKPENGEVKKSNAASKTLLSQVDRVELVDRKRSGVFVLHLLDETRLKLKAKSPADAMAWAAAISAGAIAATAAAAASPAGITIKGATSGGNSFGNNDYGKRGQKQERSMSLFATRSAATDASASHSTMLLPRSAGKAKCHVARATSSGRVEGTFSSYNLFQLAQHPQWNSALKQVRQQQTTRHDLALMGRTSVMQNALLRCLHNIQLASANPKLFQHLLSSHISDSDPTVLRFVLETLLDPYQSRLRLTGSNGIAGNKSSGKDGSNESSPPVEDGKRGLSLADIIRREGYRSVSMPELTEAAIKMPHTPSAPGASPREAEQDVLHSTFVAPVAPVTLAAKRKPMQSDADLYWKHWLTRPSGVVLGDFLQAAYDWVQSEECSSSVVSSLRHVLDEYQRSSNNAEISLALRVALLQVELSLRLHHPDETHTCTEPLDHGDDASKVQSSPNERDGKLMASLYRGHEPVMDAPSVHLSESEPDDARSDATYVSSTKPSGLSRSASSKALGLLGISPGKPAKASVGGGKTKPPAPQLKRSQTIASLFGRGKKTKVDPSDAVDSDGDDEGDNGNTNGADERKPCTACERIASDFASLIGSIQTRPEAAGCVAQHVMNLLLLPLGEEGGTSYIDHKGGFNSIVHRPWLWRLLFEILLTVPTVVRHAILEDINALLISKSANRDTLLLQGNWQSFLAPLLADCVRKDAGGMYEHQSALFVLNIFCLLHNRSFVCQSPRQLADVIKSSLRAVQHALMGHAALLPTSQTLLKSLVTTLFPQKTPLSDAPDHAHWTNVLVLCQLIRVYVLRYPGGSTLPKQCLDRLGFNASCTTTRFGDDVDVGVHLASSSPREDGLTQHARQDIHCADLELVAVTRQWLSALKQKIGNMDNVPSDGKTKSVLVALQRNVDKENATCVATFDFLHSLDCRIRSNDHVPVRSLVEKFLACDGSDAQRSFLQEVWAHTAGDILSTELSNLAQVTLHFQKFGFPCFSRVTISKGASVGALKQHILRLNGVSVNADSIAVKSGNRFLEDWHTLDQCELVSPITLTLEPKKLGSGSLKSGYLDRNVAASRVRSHTVA